MVESRTPAELFPPGEFIREELEARGWTQLDLAEILGCSIRLVNQIVTGKCSVTPNTAMLLGEAFGTGAQFWLNLETSYQLHLAKDKRKGTVAKRARLYEKAPVREMTKRGWIEATENPDVLERQLSDFFETNSLEHAARKSTEYGDVTLAQLAWLCRAKKLARCVPAAKFSHRKLNKVLEALANFIENSEEVRLIPKVLADAGIRLVVLEPLSGSKIDGACLWLDKNSPVIALSLRYDRIDWLWHTLMHEIAHVKYGDGIDESISLDVDLMNSPKEGRPETEERADQFAVEFLVPQEELQDFIVRVSPLYSKRKVRSFSERIHVHPGIVVGQLQYREEIPYSHSRAMLAKVRSALIEATLTDGWGFTPLVSV